MKVRWIQQALIPITLALFLYWILALTDGKPQDFGHPL